VTVGTRSAPLAVSQEALWQHATLNPGLTTYNETLSIRHEGPLEPAALERALGELVRRHDAWRTTFDVADGEPVRIVAPRARIELPRLDLSGLPPIDAERRAARLIAAVSAVPYDLRRGPLIRARLVRMARERHRLYLAMHHIVFDAVSIKRVILPELVELYEGFLTGGDPPALSPAVSYDALARWEHDWIEDPRVAPRLEYWCEHLQDATGTELAPDRPRERSERRASGAVAHCLSAALTERLRSLAQERGATTFQLFATGWALLLARYSGRREIVFATPADLRQRPELQNVVGYCVTPLVLRIDMDADPTGSELLLRVRDELLDGLDALIPFERIVRELHARSDPSASPLYQTMIILEPPATTVATGWSVSLLDSAHAGVGNVKVDLELALDAQPDGSIAARLTYDAALFEEASAERIVAHWKALLEALVADPDAPASTLPMLTTDERLRLAVWSAPVLEQPSGLVDELVRASAFAAPDAPAVADASGVLTYGELTRRAGAVAGRLRAAGVGPGDLVAISAQPSSAIVVAALGTISTGAAHLLLDPAAEHAGLIDGLVPSVLLTDGTRPALKAPLTLPLEAPEAAVAPSGAPARADGTCLIQGLPPAPIAHTAVTRLARGLAAGLCIADTDTFLVLASSLYRTPAVDLWTPLIAGAQIVLAPPDADGAEVSQLLASARVSRVHATAQTWEELIATGLRRARGVQVLASADGLTSELADDLLGRFRALWVAHGTPATTTYCTLGRVTQGASPTLGAPLLAVDVRVLDDRGEPVPVGAVGELVVTDDGRAVRTGERVRWRADGTLAPAPAVPRDSSS